MPASDMCRRSIAHRNGNFVWVPITAVDVWEHIYYLTYGPQRQKYVDGTVYQLLNWKQISANYDAALVGDLDTISERY